jgi:hypothetical protein
MKSTRRRRERSLLPANLHQSRRHDVRIPIERVSDLTIARQPKTTIEASNYQRRTPSPSRG